MPILIRGNPYHTVPERIKEFHEKYPNGSITTSMTFDGEKLVRCVAVVCPDIAHTARYFTGNAEEQRGSTNINRTSCVENCETSAVGRALGFAGIGAIHSIASADEVVAAIQKSSEPLDDVAQAFFEEPFVSAPTVVPVTVSNTQTGGDCLKCRSPLKKRKGPKGFFLGCTRFPDCKYTEQIV